MARINLILTVVFGLSAATCGGQADLPPDEPIPSAGSGGSEQDAAAEDVAQPADVTTTDALDGAAGAAGCSNCDPRLEQCFQQQFCVAKLEQIPGGYWIDATEVTWSQYEAWLATAPEVAGQDPVCAWNTSFAPGCGSGMYKGSYPAVCMDWCDAVAYCRGVGKRLCGKIGGGSVGYEDFDDPSLSQWFNACTSGGIKEAPAIGFECCRDSSGDLGCPSGTCHSVPVGSMECCVSAVPGYGGVYDLVGNVFEWEDSCDGATGKDDLCRTRGGGYSSNIGAARCNDPAYDQRSGVYDGGGFRCCWP